MIKVRTVVLVLSLLAGILGLDTTPPVAGSSLATTVAEAPPSVPGGTDAFVANTSDVSGGGWLKKLACAGCIGAAAALAPVSYLFLIGCGFTCLA